MTICVPGTLGHTGGRRYDAARTLRPIVTSVLVPALAGYLRGAPPDSSRLSSTSRYCRTGAILITPHAAPLTVDVRLAGGTATVAIGGELDPASTPSLAAQLRQVLDSRPERLVFDLSRVDFIDCAAARLLAGAGCSLPDGRLPVIRFAGPLVRRVFQLTGLDLHVKLEG